MVKPNTNRKLLEAVTAVIIHEEDVFVIRRQPHLRIFPGFHAFPGGKVDHEDQDFTFAHELLPDDVPASELGALFRELQEELGWELESAFEDGSILSLNKFGSAVTPSIYPVRFNTHFYRIDLAEKVSFDTDAGEIAWSGWHHRHQLRDLYLRGEALMVLPTRYTTMTLAEDIAAMKIEPFTLVYEPTRELPYIEMISDVGFIPVPSNTIPPATSTNALHLGDQKTGRVLVDPSPADEQVLQRLLVTLEQQPVDRIFLSHHHPDHHEFAPELARVLNLPVLCSEATYKNILSKKGEDYFTGVNVSFVQHGDIITEWLGKPVYCHALPGHDNGMLGLAPENMSWFFVADLVEPGTTVVIPEDVGDMQQYFTSLKYVIELNPKAVIPSHGLPMGGCHLIEQTLQHRELREAQIKALQQQGVDEDEMVHQLYDDIKPQLIPLARQNIRQHLKKINEEQALEMKF